MNILYYIFIWTALFLIPNYAQSQSSSFNVVLGEMQTTYAFWGEKRSRASNVELAASKINNIIIQPNQIFSYNDIVGARTERNGFKEAPVIINGDLTEGIGGGVCQVSGTLHASMFFAGLEIIEATQHSRKSLYIDAGLDATVFWGSKDLKMRNTYPFPIKIIVDNHRDQKRGYLNIKIMGAYKIYEIEHETIVHHKSKIKTKLILNRNLKVGQRKRIEQGTPKMDITRIRRTYKINLNNNKRELLLTETKKVHYDPSYRIIEVGPKQENI